MTTLAPFSRGDGKYSQFGVLTSSNKIVLYKELWCYFAAYAALDSAVAPNCDGHVSTEAVRDKRSQLFLVGGRSALALGATAIDCILNPSAYDAFPNASEQVATLSDEAELHIPGLGSLPRYLSLTMREREKADQLIQYHAVVMPFVVLPESLGWTHLRILGSGALATELTSNKPFSFAVPLEGDGAMILPWLASLRGDEHSVSRAIIRLSDIVYYGRFVFLYHGQSEPQKTAAAAVIAAEAAAAGKDMPDFTALEAAAAVGQKRPRSDSASSAADHAGSKRHAVSPSSDGTDIGDDMSPAVRATVAAALDRAKHGDAPKEQGTGCKAVIRVLRPLSPHVPWAVIQIQPHTAGCHAYHPRTTIGQQRVCDTRDLSYLSQPPLLLEFIKQWCEPGRTPPLICW